MLYVLVLLIIVDWVWIHPNYIHDHVLILTMFMIFLVLIYQLIVIATFVCKENQEKKLISVLFMQHLHVVMHAMAM